MPIIHFLRANSLFLPPVSESLGTLKVFGYPTFMVSDFEPCNGFIRVTVIFASPNIKLMSVYNKTMSLKKSLKTGLINVNFISWFQLLSARGTIKASY